MEYALLYTAGTDPQPYDPAADNIAEWVADLIERAVSEFGERLRPGEDATTVKVRDGRTLVTEGPFTEAKEWVGGFDIIDCADLDEAIEIAAAASRRPNRHRGGASVHGLAGRRTRSSGGAARLSRTADAGATRYLMLVCADPESAGGEPGDGSRVTCSRGSTSRTRSGVRLFGDVLRPLVGRHPGALARRSHADRPGPLNRAATGSLGSTSSRSAGLKRRSRWRPRTRWPGLGLMVLSPAWPFDVEDDHVARAEREEPERELRTEPAVEVAR